MTDTIATPETPAVEWTSADRTQPVPVVESKAEVGGFRITACNDGSWSFIARLHGVKICAVGSVDYPRPRSDALLERAQREAIAAVAALREAGAVPR